MILIVIMNSSVSDSISPIAQNLPIRHRYKCRFFYQDRTSLHEFTRVGIAIAILGHEKDYRIRSPRERFDQINPALLCKLPK